ncbi:unnamed protein product, partial [Symbiodinium microadriaticum]
AEAGRAWIGGFLELVGGCQGPWFSLEVVDSWASWAFAKGTKGDSGKVIAALELLATLVGVRLWVPDGDAKKTSRESGSNGISTRFQTVTPWGGGGKSACRATTCVAATPCLRAPACAACALKVGTKDDKKMMCSMLLQMRVDGLFPPGSYRVKTKKCNYRRRLLRALAAGGTGHLAGGGRCSWDPHALKRRMRLRAIWAARCGKSKSAAADEVSTAGSPEGPSGDEVPRAFSGELAVGPASCGCWPVPAEESTGEEHVDLRSVLQKFALPGQGPSFRSADDEGGEAAAGGQSFTNDETIQDMPFAGSLVVASKNDDQDPQRAKICCDGLETRPEKGPRSHELSFLNPSPDGAPTVSPQRAPTSLPPASQCASHGFESMLVCLGLRAEDFAFDGSWCEDDPVTQTSSKDSAGHSCLARCQGLFAESCAFDSEPAVDLQVCKQELRDSIEWCRCIAQDCPGLFGEMLADNSDDRAQFDLSTVQHGSEAGALALAVLAFSANCSMALLGFLLRFVLFVPKLCALGVWSVLQVTGAPIPLSVLLLELFLPGCTLVVRTALQAAHWVFGRLCRMQGLGHDAIKGTRRLHLAKVVLAYLRPSTRSAGKDKGKGKGKGSGDGWTPVVRKQRSLGDFVFRSQDWNSPILKPSELGAKLDGLADGDTLRGIVLVQSDDEFASISSVLRGCPKPHKMLLLRPSNEEGSQRVPGQVGDRLTFRNLAVATFCSSNSSGEMPQFQGSSGSDAKPLKVKITESAVLYVRLSKLYCDPKLWASFERAAAKEALQWAACRRVQALDSFSWSCKGKAGDSEQFFGLLRVAKKDIGPLLSSSGQQGVFVSAPRGLPDAAACEVAWVDRAPKEKPKDYLERVTRLSSAHGLALSNMRLGWRRPLDKDEAPVRVWNVTDVPREWDHCAVADLLGTAFVDPVILSHRWAKKAITYRFKAKVKAGGDRDVVPLICEHLGANVTLWASLAPPRKQPTFVKPVYTHSDEDGKDQSQSKQAKQEVRQFPSDLKLVDCPRDGNCVLHAFSKALKHFRDEDRHPRILRAELVTHLLKHERCSREWDRLDPKGQPCSDFKAYCSMIEKDSTYLGELEIAALSHICHLKTVVIPQGLDFQPAAYNAREKKVAVLWFTPEHIDLALPKDSGAQYPETYTKVTQGPVGALRAGGGSRAASSEVSFCATPLRKRAASVVSGSSGRASFAATKSIAAQGISVVDDISNFMECHNLQVCTIAEADINVASAPGYIRAWKLRGFQAALSEDIAEKFDQFDCAPFRAALSQGDVDEAWCILSNWAEECITTSDPEAQDAAAVKAQWRNLLRDDIGRQRTFVNARADAQLEFEKRVTETHEAKLAGPVHPSVMVREQNKAWVRKWQAQPIVHHDAIDQVLAKVPAVKRAQLDIEFSAEGLCSIAASIAGKAAGQDCWKAGCLCKMPLSWWAMAAELWSHIWAHAAVPKLWKDAKVTLIRKKGGPTTRPITLTQIMWRIGAKIVARALREWVQAALRRGTNTAVLMDVAGYFDAMNAQTMKKVFTHLGAPVQLALLLESFYTGARRYFCFEGSFDPECHVVHSGLAQGCPLSPIAAAALSHCWSAYIKSSCCHVNVQIFMDDRALLLEPEGSCQDLDQALSASATFDAAFSLSLSPDKCFIASSHPNEQSQQLAARWNFLTCPTLDLLGVRFEFDGKGTIPKFSLRKAVLRLRLLRWTQASTRDRINLVRTLIMPCLAWASGFAQPSREDIEAGHKAVLADQSSLYHRRAAFLSGGTTWFFNKCQRSLNDAAERSAKACVARRLR